MCGGGGLLVLIGGLFCCSDERVSAQHGCPAPPPHLLHLPPAVTVGFGHEAVLGVAGAVVDAVKTGKLVSALCAGRAGL